MSTDIDRTAWRELDRLLDEALDRPSAERAQWLDALAVEEPIRIRLRRLLARAEEPGRDEFLSRLPPVAGVPPRTAGIHGEVVGPFRLVREIGSGGMSTVWLAERVDGLVNRPVALKLPHHAWRHAQLAERMAHEREILASLNHPNIATLYDAGITPDGQPYLALEYVQGESIDAYCRTRALPLRARLVLFLQVARAIAHAHAKLIVHRDLKPSNILVTAAGEVRLLDFGIAKLLEESKATPLTEQSGRAMTPDYAAPEQIRGDAITVATDIYSLGVVLYEMLTGARPYRLQRDSRGALEDAILAAEPRLASAAAAPGEGKALRGDLDIILAKALKKKPEERYATAHAFAEDVERHLDHQPVLAQPDTWHYSARKLVARNKVAFTAALVVFATALIGGGVALHEARAANAEKQRAEEARKFLTAVLQNANPYVAAGQPRTVEQWLVQASDSVEHRADISPELRVETLTILGTALLNAQNTAAAERVLSRAVGHARAELPPDHALTLHARGAYASLLRFRGRTKQLRAELADLLPRLRAHPALNAEDLTTALRNQAHVDLDDGRFAQGEAAAREELALALKLFGPENPESITAVMMVAYAVQRSRDPAYALKVSEDAYRTVWNHYHAQPQFPRMIEAERFYGRALGDAGHLTEALTHMRVAVDNASAAFGDASRMTGLSMIDLSRIELKQGEIENALAHSRKALTIVALHSDPDSFRYADALAARGNASVAAGLRTEGIADLEAAARIFAATLGPAHSITKATQAAIDVARQPAVATGPGKPAR